MNLFKITAIRNDYYMGQWGKCGSYDKIVPEEMVEEKEKELRNYRGPATGFAQYSDIQSRLLTEEEIAKEVEKTKKNIQSIELDIEYKKKEIEGENTYLEMLEKGLEK